MGKGGSVPMRAASFHAAQGLSVSAGSLPRGGMLAAHALPGLLHRFALPGQELIHNPVRHFAEAVHNAVLNPLVPAYDAILNLLYPPTTPSSIFLKPSVIFSLTCTILDLAMLSISFRMSEWYAVQEAV